MSQSNDSLVSVAVLELRNMNNVDEEIFDILNGLDCRDAIVEPYMDVFTGVLNNDEYF